VDVPRRANLGRARTRVGAAQTISAPAKQLSALSLPWLEASRAAATVHRRNLKVMQRLRSTLLEELSRSIENYLRSPAFLYWMKYQLALLNSQVAAMRPLKGRQVPEGRAARHGHYDG
jgi:hypothetical protein